ncbi:cytochrome b/b6 domain-containing protein, partial [bacterium]|nr:cytochrome b/b6 domain-containing protein [bacterium]
MNDEVHIWDILVRTLHWTLVVTFTIAYLTEDDLMTLHAYSGYAVLVIVLTRMVWGLIGTRYARFSNFIYSPKTIIAYLKDLARLHAKRYIGHNPAGGAMIILLLLFLILTGVS